MQWHKKLSELTTNGQIWNIKVKVTRHSESVNNKTDEFISLDVILMDEKVYVLLDTYYKL
jgi:hypothetical protein